MCGLNSANFPRIFIFLTFPTNLRLNIAMKRVYRDEDPTNPPQSRVVHVRNLSPTVIEADLIDALSNFGNILYIAIMNKQMALVTFLFDY